MKPSKEEIALTSKISAPTKVAPSSSSKTSTASPSNALKITSTASSAGPVTEDEIRAVLMQKTPVTTQDLVAKFKSRLKSKEVSVCFSCSVVNLYFFYQASPMFNFVSTHSIYFEIPFF